MRACLRITHSHAADSARALYRRHLVLRGSRVCRQVIAGAGGAAVLLLGIGAGLLIAKSKRREQDVMVVPSEGIPIYDEPIEGELMPMEMPVSGQVVMDSSQSWSPHGTADPTARKSDHR